MFGGDGNDTIREVGPFGGNDSLFGGAGDDWIEGRFGNDSLFGGSGSDRLDGGVQNDLLNGGSGNDTLLGGRNSDGLIGGPGDDLLRGQEEDDFLDGGAGFDTLDGGAGLDTAIYSSFSSGVDADLRTQRVEFRDAPGISIDQLSSIENLTGTQGHDLIVGSFGNNRIDGQGGSDLIAGGPGNDDILGGAGTDTFSDSTSAGDDRFSGGAGADRFLFFGPATGSLPFENDTVTDFERGSDTIEIIGFNLRFQDLDTDGVRGVLDNGDARVSVIGGATVIDLSDGFGQPPGSDTITALASPTCRAATYFSLCKAVTCSSRDAGEAVEDRAEEIVGKVRAPV